MHGFALIFVIINVILIFKLPRRWAPLPLLMGTCYMTLGQNVELGVASFSAGRFLILAGFFRVFLRGERLANGLSNLDWWMLSWAGWALFSSLLHKNPMGSFVNRAGMVFNTCGIYFLFRIWCQNFEDVFRFCRTIAIALIPVAIAMLIEKTYTYNLFSFLGGVPEVAHIREGKVRAQGPFAHAILAGTVGAVNLPLVASLWHRYRKLAFYGVAACLAIVYASGSSGPVMSVLVAIGVAFMWRFRANLRFGKVLGLATLGYICLNIVMTAPAYFLMARIDITGGSTGWYRARLIQSTFEHFNEWWMWGTDYTRHWMPTGVPYSPDHADIVNHYISQGVLGGLPQMLIFITIMVKCFLILDRKIWQDKPVARYKRFVMWTMGATLASHAVTFFGVTYFDQSFFFLYALFAMVGTLHYSKITDET